MNQRYKSLDSIRGIAAISVFFGHCLTISPSIFPTLVRYSPFRFLWGSHEAVILFFILSGFVLSLPFYKSKVDYVPFIIKRFFRIYLPYLITILFSIILISVYKTQTISITDTLNHLFLIANFNTDQFDPVIWSLVHEMRISIIFPFIMILILRYSWKTNIIVCVLLSAVSGLNQVYHFEESIGYFTGYFNTLHFISMFIIGALIAKHRVFLIEMVQKFSKANQCILLLFGLFCYDYGEVFLHTSISNKYILSEWVISVGVTIFIIAALSIKKVEKTLLWRHFQFSGKISYSFYLYHLVIMLTLVSLLKNSTPILIIFLISALLSVIISTLSWFFIEKTSIKLGKTVYK